MTSEVQMAVERIVRERFYSGPMAGSTERLASALIEEFGLAALSHPVPVGEGAREIPDFLKRMTGELPPAPMPKWRDDDGREGRREGAEEDPATLPSEGEREKIADLRAIIEPILIRRIVQQRMDGFTISAAEEIAGAILRKQEPS